MILTQAIVPQAEDYVSVMRIHSKYVVASHVSFVGPKYGHVAADNKAGYPGSLWAASEAAKELVGGKPHHLLAVSVGSELILEAEGSPALIEVYKPTVRDRDQAYVAQQIGQHGLGSSERQFYIDQHRFFLTSVKWSSKARQSSSCASLPKKVNLPAS